MKATMTPALWQRLKPLYNAALEMPKDERAEFVVDACKADSALRIELQALLSNDTQSTNNLDAPLLDLHDLYPAKRQAFKEGDVLLQRFRIVRLLGCGGMGEVYEAEDLRLRKVHVALKTILFDKSGDDDSRERFSREVLLAREANHPNLCPVYDIFESEEGSPGFLFLTMKLLPGCTLAERLRAPGAISAEEGTAILARMALGLAAIHAAGVVHRDIKPNNIMLDGSGINMRLWITDFGLARARHNDTTASAIGVLAGTPGYIAPELYLGQTPSHATDLFAFGVLLHEVFTGQKPLPNSNPSANRATASLASSNVPPFCAKLIAGCLSHDPKRRCKAFAHALEHIDPKVDRSNYDSQTQTVWTRRRFAVGMAAGACIFSGGAWWKWDEIENILHPLPQKRFVALLNWPKSSDAKVAPMLTAALDAIKSELSRFEALDHDLFVVSMDDLTGNDSPAKTAQIANLQDACNTLGANMVLAASALYGAQHLKLPLRLLDPITGHTLRERTLDCSLLELTSLPRKAVEAAASLLNLKHYLQSDQPAGNGTRSSAAFTSFHLAETLIKLPNDSGLDAAIEKYKQAIELDQRYSNAYARLALAYCRLGAIRHDPGIFDLARGNCNVALSLNPDLVDAHLALATVLELTGDAESALSETRKALALDPADPRILVKQGQIYCGQARWQDAERTIRRALVERPNNWLAYNELGAALNSQGKYSEAIKKFRAACVAAPGNSLAFNNVGSIYLQLGDYPEAIDYLQKSFALKPNGIAAQNISAALRLEAKPSEALPFALKAVQLEPAEHFNWLELADCYTSLRSHEKSAREAYTKAALVADQHLHINPEDGSAWMGLALYQVKTGNRQDALSLIQKAESVGATDVDSQLCKARILELLGHRDSALSTLKTCFRNGATDFQISSAPDLQSLQRDPQYRQLLQAYATNKKDS